MADVQLRKLARQLARAESRLSNLETVPQLAHSSIDDGALPVYDKDGNLVTKVGKQDDGTWGAPPLAGPTPSAPMGVTATGGPGSINVSWTGEYERDAAPLDFDTLEVLIDGVLAGGIPNRDGGTVSISAEQGWRFVSARIRTLVPRHSGSTSPFSVEVGPPADQLFLDAREAIEAAEEQIQQGKDDLEAERLAREAALAEAAQTLTELEERLDGIADSEDLQDLRDQIAAAQEAVEQAQADATAAGEAVAGATAEATAAKAAAETANDNALAAAGIARDKGRIYYQPTAPTDEEAKSPNNLWIDSDDGRVYVWSGTAWTESESESLRDAAQAALVAQQTAEAADSKAQQAVAAAAEADRKAGEAADAAEDARAAAAAAQKTADDATIDAREAHNEAVAAAERADEIRADLASGPSVWEDPSFERGWGGLQDMSRYEGRIDRSQEWAASGEWSVKYTSNGSGGNNYGAYLWQPVLPGHWYSLSVTAHAPEFTQQWRGTWQTFDEYSGTALRNPLNPVITPGPGETVTTTWFFDVNEGENWIRFWAGQAAAYNKEENTGQAIYIDDFRLVDVTDSYPQYLAAQAAADAAQQAAEDAYDLAESKPGMDEVNQAIVVSSNGKNAITVSASAPTSSTPGVVVGDTWWRVDGNGDIFGQWSWTGSAWSAREILSDVIANLDVGKLTVTGSSRFNVAVVDRLFADIFAAHKITANELTIAALDENGEIKPDSVEAVMIKDGQISANKILLLGDPNDPDEAALVATIASIMKLAVENLVVTDGAVIDFAVIEKLATQMVTAGVIRTADEGQRVVIDQSGIVMYGLDPDGNEFELVRIGPSGDNIITAGDTTISPAGVQGPSGDFDTLSVGGDDLATILDVVPKGIIAWGEIREHSAYDTSMQLQRRAELQTRLRTGRLYRVAVSTRYISNNYTAATWAVDALHYSYDAVPIFPNDLRAGSYQGMSSRHLVQAGLNTVPSMEFFLNTEGHADNRLFWVMYSLAGSHRSAGVRLTAAGNYSMVMSIEDLGPSQDRIVKRWNDNDGGGAQDPGTPVQRYSKTYNSNGYRCYNLDGSDAGRPDVVHGLYSGGPSNFRRRGGWTFPNMTNDLSGASVEKVEMYIYCNHTYASAGSTVRPAVWGGNMANNLTAFTTINGWKRNTGRWITIPSSYYNGFKSGSYSGVGVIPSSNSATQFARFNPTGAKIRITYTK